MYQDIVGLRHMEILISLMSSKRNKLYSADMFFLINMHY